MRGHGGSHPKSHPIPNPIPCHPIREGFSPSSSLPCPSQDVYKTQHQSEAGAARCCWGQGPWPARINPPDGLIRAVRTNLRTSARGSAGSASQKSKLALPTPSPTSRIPVPPPPSPPGRTRPHGGGSAAPRASPLPGTEADLRSCRKYICYWERFDISHVKRLRAGGAQASGRKLP